MKIAFRRIGQDLSPVPKACSSLVALACAALFCLSGCARLENSSPVITVEHSIAPAPPRVGASVVTLKLADSSAQPVSGARITLEADMSHAGMAPVFAEANQTGPGQYQGQLKLEMPGDWIILLHVRMPGGQTLERRFSVASVRQD